MARPRVRGADQGDHLVLAERLHPRKDLGLVPNGHAAVQGALKQDLAVDVVVAAVVHEERAA